MKRNLYSSIKPLPYTSGTAVDRAVFLSAVLSASVSAAGTLSIAITHSDTEGGAYTAVGDESIGMGKTLTGISVGAGDLLVIPLDLVGCKRYIKITCTAGNSAAAAYALVLGDPAAVPVGN